MKRNVFVFHENHNKKRFLECTNTKGIKVVVIGKNYLLKLLKLKITKNSPSFSHEKFTHVEKGVRWCSSIFNFPPTIPRERRAQKGVYPKWITKKSKSKTKIWS